MTIHCTWEHNGSDTLLYAAEPVGAYARGENLDAALKKMPGEVSSYYKWRGQVMPCDIKIAVTCEKASTLTIRDADSDVLLPSETLPLTVEEYETLKALTLDSAKDFFALYESIPDKDAAAAPLRQTFYGPVPRTAHEMYEHTKNVNKYYFGEIGVKADNNGTIYECRQRGFAALESLPDFLQNALHHGSYAEDWTLCKVLRRFIWHDRIHAKAMYRMGTRLFRAKNIINPFRF